MTLAACWHARPSAVLAPGHTVFHNGHVSTVAVVTGAQFRGAAPMHHQTRVYDSILELQAVIIFADNAYKYMSSIRKHLPELFAGEKPQGAAQPPSSRTCSSSPGNLPMSFLRKTQRCTSRARPRQRWWTFATATSL